MSAPDNNDMRTAYQHSYANPLTALQQQQQQQQQAPHLQQQYPAFQPAPSGAQQPWPMQQPSAPQQPMAQPQPAAAQPPQPQRQPSGLSRAMSYEETYRLGSFLKPSAYSNTAAPQRGASSQSAFHQQYPPQAHHPSNSLNTALGPQAPYNSYSAVDPQAPSAPPQHQHIPSYTPASTPGFLSSSSSQPQHQHQPQHQPPSAFSHTPGFLSSSSSLTLPQHQPSLPFNGTPGFLSSSSSLTRPQHQPSSTADDAAIAHALARELGTSPSMRLQRAQESIREEDTSLDHALALQTHDEEVEKLCRQERGAATPSPEPPSPPGVFDTAWNNVLQGASNLIPVIPRVNNAGPWGIETISKDRDRLQCRLDFYALAEKQVKGDGNCQFRALSDQLYGSEGHHARVRHLAVQQLAARADKYSMYVPTDYGSYVNNMAQDGTWGDHVTLQAVADTLGVHIHVVSSFLENGVISIHPSDEDEQAAGTADPSHTLWISFWAEVHYNSIYPKANGGNSRKVLGSRTLGKVVRALSPGMH